ncbi:MAG: TIGR03757 family integrating conjugative element protein [Gammaproteobacteria bacterium]
MSWPSGSRLDAAVEVQPTGQKPDLGLRGFSLPRVSVRADDGEHRPAIRDTEMLALSHALVGLTLFGPLALSAPVWAGEALVIEVFTTGEQPVVGGEHERLRTATVTIYVVDSLDRFESGLSEGLPADPEAAKAEALRRIQHLDDARMVPAKNAAYGLAKAVQYGVDRYPAIVFDGRAVVYGVTDLVEALDLYEAWQREQTR